MMEKSSVAIRRNGFASQFSNLKQRRAARGCKSLSHTLWDCRDPILFIPQYRQKVFFKEVRKEIGEILRTLCEYQDVEWGKGSMSADHVHRYVRIPPKRSVSEFMGYLKGKSARMIFDRFSQMTPGCGGIT